MTSCLRVLQNAKKRVVTAHALPRPPESIEHVYVFDYRTLSALARRTIWSAMSALLT